MCQGLQIEENIDVGNEADSNTVNGQPSVRSEALETTDWRNEKTVYQAIHEISGGLQSDVGTDDMDDAYLS